MQAKFPSNLQKEVKSQQKHLCKKRPSSINKNRLPKKVVCCQVQYHQFNKWVKNIVTPIKTHVFHFTHPSIFIEFTFLVEIIFLKLGFLIGVTIFLTHLLNWRYWTWQHIRSRYFFWQTVFINRTWSFFTHKCFCWDFTSFCKLDGNLAHKIYIF